VRTAKTRAKLRMKSKRTSNGGFVGLLMLFIGVAIIIFVLVRTDIFTGQKDGKNVIEQGIDAVDQAREVKDLIEKNNRQSTEEGDY
jgi:hypothetical protein